MASRQYINNRKLFEEMVKYRAQLLENRAAGKPDPRANDYIGQAIMLIATKLSNKPNFAGYSYKEEMVADGVTNCIKYALTNFNPEKSNNPFAYFTQTIHNAFLRRIKEEKRQQAIRHKHYEQFQIMELNGGQSNPSTRTGHVGQEAHYGIINAYEEKLARRKPVKPVAPRGLEQFVEDEENDL